MLQMKRIMNAKYSLNNFICIITLLFSFETGVAQIIPTDNATLNYIHVRFQFPEVKGAAIYKLEIFDRWGELIFESDEVRKGWDGYYRGKLCQQDVYVWKAYVKLNTGKKYEKVGDVTLLR